MMSLTCPALPKCGSQILQDTVSAFFFFFKTKQLPAPS